MKTLDSSNPRSLLRPSETPGEVGAVSAPSRTLLRSPVISRSTPSATTRTLQRGAAGSLGSRTLRRTPSVHLNAHSQAMASPAAGSEVVDQGVTLNTAPSSTPRVADGSIFHTARTLQRPVRPGGHSGRVVKQAEKRASLLQRKTDIRRGDRSRLEAEAVAEVTSKEYGRQLSLFDDYFSQTNWQQAETLDDLELQTLEYMDHMYLEGAPVGAGTKLLASLASRWPQLHRSQGFNFHRVRRALQGWARIAPSAERLPIPWLGIAGIAATLLAMGEWCAALAVVLAADAYLRPGEVLSLTTLHVVRPRLALGGGHRFASLSLFPAGEGTASKVGVFNDSVVLDSTNREWLTDILLRRCNELKRGQSLFPYTYPQFLRLFQKAADTAGLSAWQVSPHILRHSGPSHDHLNGLRSLADIKRRGRWSADRSVRRYEKSSMVTGRFSELDETAIGKLQLAERQLPALFQRRFKRRLD
jgi:integrase